MAGNRFGPMKLTNASAEIFVPDDQPQRVALPRTTHLGVGAHQDDLEFMCLHGILDCFLSDKKWFTGVTVTDGRGSPREGAYAACSDDQMRDIRRKEQRKAAVVGEYASMISLNYPSAEIKRPGCRSLIEDLATIFRCAAPDFVYTHNLADKHDTHIAVALPVILALRSLPKEAQPTAVYGCEVWRSLDWLLDTDKVVFDVSERENLSLALMGVFDSQISGGKRYDQATHGRKRSNATYFASHSTDRARLLEYAMDLTPLIQNPSLDIAEFVHGFVRRFAEDVLARIRKFSG